jgi:hypothetical protein
VTPRLAVAAVLAVLALAACSAGHDLAGDERACAAVTDLVDHIGAGDDRNATAAAIGTFREAAADANEGDLRQASERLLSAADRYLADPSSAPARTELATGIYGVTTACDVIGHPLREESRGS